MKRDDWVLIIGAVFLGSVIVHRIWNKDQAPTEKADAKIQVETTLMPAAQAILAAFDADGDSMISLTEYGHVEQRFSSIDANGDGQLDLPELLLGTHTPANGKRPGCSRFVRGRDTNADGALSKSELSSDEREFLSADVDHDGLLFPIEICFSKKSLNKGIGGNKSKD